MPIYKLRVDLWAAEARDLDAYVHPDTIEGNAKKGYTCTTSMQVDARDLPAAYALVARYLPLEVDVEHMSLCEEGEQCENT